MAPQQLPPSSHGCFQVVSHLRWPFDFLCQGISTICLFSDYFRLYCQGLGLNLRLSARTCVRSSQSSTKWVESTLCQDPSTWATRTLLSFITYYVLVIIMCQDPSTWATRTFLAMQIQIHRNIHKQIQIHPVSGSFHLGNNHFPSNANTKQEYNYHKNYELHHNAAVMPVVKLQIPDPPCG